VVVVVEAWGDAPDSPQESDVGESLSSGRNLLQGVTVSQLCASRNHDLILAIEVGAISLSRKTV
jgi:hypothetical protein